MDEIDAPTPDAALAPPAPRRHDLDALRAVAMLLGIVLHAALSYTGGPWVVVDGDSSPTLGVLVAGIHGFRMPLFFLLSGFFTAMLWRRRGTAGLLKQRATRIALPLLLGCATVVPAMWVVIVGASILTGDDAAAAQRDIWTAAARGRVGAIEMHLAGGASPDLPDPSYGVTPLNWTAVFNHPEATAALLRGGADPDAVSRDGRTPLHTAAFFGRVEVARALVEGGADPTRTTPEGESVEDLLAHGRDIVEAVATEISIEVDLDEVVEAKEKIHALLARAPLVERRAPRTDSETQSAKPNDPAGTPLRRLIQLLFGFPIFHHLWFLWFLCWLVAGFAATAAVLRRLPKPPVPRILVATPLALVWLVPCSMLTQAHMHGGGTLPGFGPDTSTGLLPVPHVLLHYAVFFGFGAILQLSVGTEALSMRRWWLLLFLAVAIFPLAHGLSTGAPWASALVGLDASRVVLANLGEVLFAWLMIFGAMGLFARLLPTERRWARRLAEASFWMYLAHLPLVIAGQALLHRIDLPPLVEVAALTGGVALLLLACDAAFIRYTWVGTLLHGPRTRE